MDDETTERSAEPRGGPEFTGPLLERARSPRSLIAALLLLWLTSPLLVPIAMWHIAPITLESLYARYTGLDHAYFLEARQSGQPLSPGARRFVRETYLERAAVETIVRVYNPLKSALGLAGLAVALSLLGHGATVRFRRAGRWTPWLATGAFFFLFGGVSALWGAPLPLLLGAFSAIVFAVSFPLARAIGTLLKGPEAQVLAMGIALVTPYVSHILAPVIPLLCSARSLCPDSPRAARSAVAIGRSWACAIGFPVLAILFLAARDVPLSPQATRLLAVRDLYDVEVDEGANRVLVTTKQGGKGYIFGLDPAGPIGEFDVPTAELEDIVLDPDRREIYHVDRATRTILVLDADDFRVRRAAKIAVPASGSTKLALVRSANRLVVSWENDYLMIVDRDTLKVEAATRTGNVNPLADEDHAIVYIKPGDEPVVDALDPRTLRIVARAPGPRLGERLALSPKRRELYAPDARGAQLWVYSTPNLEVLRKVPTQFGVRALAVDDEHGLLLAASAVTGYVDVIDLNTGRTVQHQYVGTYGRIIGLDPPRRHAFITITKEGLFLLKY